MNDQKAPQKDHRWQSVFDYVPCEFLMKLAFSQKNHKPENLTKGQEELVNEIFRVCGEDTIQKLYEQFPGIEGTVWFYSHESKVFDELHIKRSISENIDDDLKAGIDPQIQKEPTLYRVDQLDNTVLFHFAAKDSAQNIRTGLGQRTRIEVVNEYVAVVHFSVPKLLIFGPYTTDRANAVAAKIGKTLELDVEFQCVKPKRGEGRFLYQALKSRLKAYLIDTKRLDTSGDYKTVALESREKHPDLEKVPNFRKQYLDSESLYDVLQFSISNPLGVSEKTHVKMGRPFGRFTFAPHTSLAAIYHFEKTLYAVL
ncbi:MAG TPA: hypothetical protein VN223_04645 [Candidatus Elarobacter sp.]|nr:hypothetical protein [Candidatus Elarobacter sp.]